MKKNNVIYFITSFLLPLVTLSFFCIITGHYPFGDKLLFKYDGLVQYPSFFVELSTKIKNGESLFYTLHAGLGNNFIAINNYYTNSPLNLIFLFFETTQIYQFLTMLIYIKIGLIGLTLYTYLNHLNNTRKRLNLIFSTLYAVSSYSLFFIYQVMWMDGIILAPLIMYGIDKIVDNKRVFYYIIFLTLAIFTNFYIGYMLCIFSVIYFIYRIVDKANEKLKTLKKFILSSLVCGILSLIIIVPTGIAILNLRFDSIDIGEYFQLNLKNAIIFFYNLMPNSILTTDNMNYGSPIIYCSLFVVVLDIMYFFNEKINKNKKLVVGGILLFFLASFSINLLDYGWNIFQRPVWWNSRYSFCFILFMIIIAYNSYINIKSVKINYKSRFLITLALAILIFIGFHYKILYSIHNNDEFLGLTKEFSMSDWKKIYALSDYNSFLNLLLTIIGILFIEIYLYVLDKDSKIIQYVILIMLVTETSYNGYNILNDNDNNSASQQIEYLETRADIINKIKENDTSFYRIYILDDISNSGLLYGYNSIELFSSIYNKRILNFYKDIGANRNQVDLNHIKIDKNSLELFSLLSTKYIIDNENNMSTNEYILPLGFLIDDNQTIELNEQCKMDNIEKIYQYLANTDMNIYSPTNVKTTYKDIYVNDDGDFVLQNSQGQITYSFVSDINGIVEINKLYGEIQINGKMNYDEITNINIGDEVIINYYIFSMDENVKQEDVEFRVLDLKNFKYIVNSLNKNALIINNQDKSHVISGEINVEEENKKLFLSIPYDECFKIKVDGVNTDYNEEFNTFISIKLNKGKHNITIDYVPKGYIVMNKE